MTFPLFLGLAGGGAALLGVLLALALGYRHGRNVGAGLRSPHLERLPVELQLHGTRWRLQLCEFGRAGPRPRTAEIAFRQYDSRVLAEGCDDSGGRWTAEGAALGKQLLLTVVESAEGRFRAGLILLSRSDDGEGFTGHRCAGSDAGASLDLHPVRLLPEVDRAGPVAPSEAGCAASGVLPPGNAG
jgi:hypothetical protein